MVPRTCQEGGCPRIIDTSAVASDQPSSVMMFEDEELSVLPDQMEEDEEIVRKRPESCPNRPARPNIKRGTPYSRDPSSTTSKWTSHNRLQPGCPLYEKIKEEYEKKPPTPESKRQRYDVPETTTQSRLRHRELLSHLHCKQTPVNSQDRMYDSSDLQEIFLRHAQLVEQALGEIVERYPCVGRTCYCPIMRRLDTDEPSRAVAHSDDQSEWFSGSLDSLMKKLDLGELLMYSAVPIGLEEADLPIPIALAPAKSATVSPTILSPPSQPPTPSWTMKTEPPLPDLAASIDESNISPTPSSDLINDRLLEGATVIMTPRNRSRAQTLSSADQVIKIKQGVEEWENQQVEVETEGIRVMKALQERYRLEGKPWITAVGKGDDPVQVWVDEWKLEPSSDGDVEAVGNLSRGKKATDKIPDALATFF